MDTLSSLLWSGRFLRPQIKAAALCQAGIAQPPTNRLEWYKGGRKTPPSPSTARPDGQTWQHRGLGMAPGSHSTPGCWGLSPHPPPLQGTCLLSSREGGTLHKPAQFMFPIWKQFASKNSFVYSESFINFPKCSAHQKSYSCHSLLRQLRAHPSWSALQEQQLRTIYLLFLLATKTLQTKGLNIPYPSASHCSKPQAPLNVTFHPLIFFLSYYLRYIAYVTISAPTMPKRAPLVGEPLQDKYLHQIKRC